MKQNERIEIIRKSVENWNNDNPFGYNFKPVNISNKFVEKLFEKYEWFSMVEDYYDSEELGIYECCWQELIEEGVWGLTKEQVKRSILSVFSQNKDVLKQEERVFISENDNLIDILVVLRDINYVDYRIHFRRRKL